MCTRRSEYAVVSCFYCKMSDEVVCQVFKSTRNGMKLYLDGYTYNKVSTNKRTYYWACEMKNDELYQCKGMLRTTLNEKDEHILLKEAKNHSHEPDPMRKKVADFRNKLKDDVTQSTSTKFCKILNDSKSETDCEITESLPSTSALKQSMYRAKRKLHGKLEEPTDLEFDIDESITQIKGQSFVIKDRQFDNKRIIMMSTLKHVTILSKSDYWILDGTFKVVPSIFTQLYTIHGNIFSDDKKTFPLVFFLCSHKDKRTYDVMFEMLMEYGAENNIVIKPKVCILDFEKAAISSLRSNFEELILHGCNFHLGQIIYRKVQSSGFAKKYALDGHFNKDIKCLLALSYLDETDIPQYFEKHLESLTDEDSKTIAYWFKENYVSGTGNGPAIYSPGFWSCNEMNSMKIPRTSNSAEAWHHKINQIIDKHHPGLYFLIKELIKETLSNESAIEQKMTGAPPEKKKKKYVSKDERIDRILMLKDNYSEAKLLKSIAGNLKL